MDHHDHHRDRNLYPNTHPILYVMVTIVCIAVSFLSLLAAFNIWNVEISDDIASESAHPVGGAGGALLFILAMIALATGAQCASRAWEACKRRRRR